MKIDLHCHTQKVKTGDAVTRNVTPEKFATKITEADVKIVAITNHNKFDYKQYLQLKESVKDICNVWPGVELDIQGKSDEDGKVKRGHLIVIANPDNAEIFAKNMEELIQDQSPDEFLTDVVTVFDKLDECDTIYIPHFHKEPHLSEEDIEELNAHLKDRSRLFKETSDYRSLGVFSNFDYSVIIGSDVQNWDNYEKSKFADIRLPIDTFQQFCLLAKKDKQIIDTLLNKKRKKNITVSPHKSICFEIPIYEDINIIFGQKGTGKSEIINSLKTYYEKNIFADMEMFEQDCLRNTRIMKRLTSIVLKNRLKLFFDNYDKVPEIVKENNLKIDFDEAGKIVYKDKSELYRITNLIADAYFKSLLLDRLGVAKLEGDVEE